MIGVECRYNAYAILYVYRDFLGFVEMQQKKKIQDAKLTSEFMTNFTSTVEEDEEVMLKQLDTLEEESYVSASFYRFRPYIHTILMSP